MAAFDDVARSPLALALLDELNRRGYSLDNPSTDEVFDAVAAELKARPAAEQQLAKAVRRFGGSRSVAGRAGDRLAAPPGSRCGDSAPS